MTVNMKRIMQRVEWIQNNLRSGRHWNSSTLAAEFGLSLKTAQRTISEFRRVYPGWRMRFDPAERTYYLDTSLPIDKQTVRPGRLEMSAAEFAEIRERLYITQDQLAYCINTSQWLVSGWELGKASIPTDIVLLMRAWDRACKFGLWSGRQRRIYRKK